jgi:hypothetical protein
MSRFHIGIPIREIPPIKPLLFLPLSDCPDLHYNASSLDFSFSPRLPCPRIGPT